MEWKLFDTHFHLVPGVDDGAADLDMAKVLLCRAWDQGVRAIVATPHSNAFEEDPDRVRRNFAQLQGFCCRFFPELTLYLGCEVYCTPASMGRVLEMLEAGTLPSLNGTRYVLTEFSMWAEPEGAVDCARRLLEAGWIPVIAHVERYRGLRGAPTRALKAMGCRLQVNVYSLYDEADEAMKAWARELVTERLVDFLGSDAHRTYHRPPSVYMGMEYLYAHEDLAYIQAIAWDNPVKALTE